MFLISMQSKYILKNVCGALDTPQKSWGTFRLLCLHIHIRVWLYFPWFLFFPCTDVRFRDKKVSATFSRAFHLPASRFSCIFPRSSAVAALKR